MITPDITRLSPNFNDAPVTGRTVIIHSTRSGKSMNPSEFIGTLNYMGTPGNTSSHWVIGRDGTKARVVRDNLQAWHAAEDNDNCWGIELEQGVEEDGFTVVQLEALVEVCHSYVNDFNVAPVHCSSSASPGFIGHQETVQGKRSGKSDPGRHFPWPWFTSQLMPVTVPPRTTQGWSKEGPFEILWNDGVDVLLVGGSLPGQIRKRFGDEYWFLRKGPAGPDGTAPAYWSLQEGD